ncbi:MAG: GH25 family lysozyme [Beijerinckiaceae bacterium]
MVTLQRLLQFAALGCVVALLASCAGGEDFLEPAEPNGHHPFPERHATPGRHHHEIHGIDIAKYQGEIDWHAVRRGGVDFAFIKATEGTDRLDERFAQNWAAAKAAGVPRGAYHFNYWCRSMEEQFQWFRRNVPRDRDALPPVLDLEWNHVSPTCPRKVSRAHAQSEIRKFVRLAEAWYGKRPILYTDIRFYRDVLADGSFSQYPLWVRATKKLPQEFYKGRKWVFWQYSDRSRIPGIRGKVDKNAFAGSRRDWQRLVASNFGHGSVAGPATRTEPRKPETKQPAAPPPTAVATARKPAATEPLSAQTTPVAQTQNAAPAQAPASSPARAIVEGGKVTVADNTPVESTPNDGKRATATPPGKPLSLAPVNLSPAKPKAAASR